MYIAAMRVTNGLHRRLNRGRLRFLRLIGLILLPFCASAQQMPVGHDMGEMLPITPPDQLPAPVRMTGIGNAHISITAAPEAQAWFDQGLNLLHDFWDYESMKAFEQGIRVDPNCAMCWWGLAQAEQSRG